MIELSFDEYMHIRNLGKKSYLEIKEKLARFGFKLEDPAD
jgi:DNA-directed RNA polymerase alpha subunit